MTSADMVGYAATVVGTSMMLPQLVKSWRTKHMRDVAFGTIILFVLNCALWGIYGVMIAAEPMIVANVIGFVISIALLSLKLRYRHN
ncbi:MAG: SemiSWEET family transporter [Verrucomicrobia bacterium]|nr:SemiSWEET family transporter [Verrucomicrobiota bacterium]